MRVAVYSGSFDPLHIGHLAILRCLGDMGGFDATYLIVSPQNPLKDAGKAASGLRRLEAAREAVARHPEVKAIVSDIEFGMEAPHYTIRTLDTLRNSQTGDSFTLVMGSDNLAVIRKWKDYARILLEYGVIVYPRKGDDIQSLIEDLHNENPRYRIEVIDAPMVDISSTQIREAIARGEDCSEFLM